ncbi:hypothetical protein L7F22_069457 [Adiantum nelumboides]|nr:hypothetical protein [Adiantum nelumboides]
MEKLAASCSDIFVGSLVSLTSKSEIRYEGMLFTLDTENSTIVLKDVHSYGTQGRGTNILQIPPSNKVYEYIIFRNTDIKDLNVVAFSHNLDNRKKGVPAVITPQDVAQNHVSGHCLDICLGWPVLPQPSQMQAGPYWWQWLFSSPTSGSYGIFPNALLATSSNSENKTTPMSSWCSVKEENCDAPVQSSVAKLSISKQVPNFIQRTQSLAMLQHPSAAKRVLMTGHERFQLKGLPPTDTLWQQPLLPLPVSESEHRRLMRESKGLANLQHARKPRVRSRGRSKRASSKKKPFSNLCPEADCSLLEFSKDFDFEAMNEHFNKKDLWNHMELSEQQGMHTSGKKDDPSETISDSTSTSNDLSRKARFVDGFFDLSLSEGDSCKENRPKESHIVKQHQIDSETFGASAVPRRDGRRGMHNGALWGGHHISIRSK